MGVSTSKNSVSLRHRVVTEDRWHSKWPEFAFSVNPV